MSPTVIIEEKEKYPKVIPNILCNIFGCKPDYENKIEILKHLIPMYMVLCERCKEKLEVTGSFEFIIRE